MREKNNSMVVVEVGVPCREFRSESHCRYDHSLEWGVVAPNCHCGLCSAVAPSRGRLKRLLGKRRWDEAIQRTVEARMGAKVPWHEVAEQRETWHNMEAEFIRRVLRRHACAVVPL